MGKLCPKNAILRLEIDGNQNAPEVKPQNHKKIHSRSSRKWISYFFSENAFLIRCKHIYVRNFPDVIITG